MKRRTYFRDPEGPKYPNLGVRVAKYRKIPREEMTPAHRHAYADAIEDAIRSLQRQALQRELPTHRCPCASGTYHNNADGKVGAAIRAQQHAAILRAPDVIRGKRTPAEWQAMYDEAMAEKRRREAQANDNQNSVAVSHAA